MVKVWSLVYFPSPSWIWLPEDDTTVWTEPNADVGITYAVRSSPKLKDRSNTHGFGRRETS